MQLINVCLAAVWVALSGEPTPSAVAALAAAGAGIGITFSVWAFFEAMVIGTMSIVAPVAASGVALPVAVGLINGERPSAIQVAGLVVVVAGVVLVSRSTVRAVRREAFWARPRDLRGARDGSVPLVDGAGQPGWPRLGCVIARIVPAVLLALVFAIRRPSISGFSSRAISPSPSARRASRSVAWRCMRWRRCTGS